MTWQQTHARWQVLRDVESALDRDPLAAPAWHEQYADLFSDRDGLVAFLRYRWQLRLAEPPLDDRHREHPARTVARVGLAALDLQEARRAAA
jgi:hypothetical protein